MTGPALLDVNVLVALFDPDHVHHEAAHRWFGEHRSRGWATCPLTENGLVRVLSSAAYRSAPVPPGETLSRLRTFCASGHHVFWPDSASLRDQSLFPARALGHRQLTDVYLLGLARSRNGRLATFDRSVRTASVAGARSEHLVVIPA
jgi:hypothetical protein